MSSEFDDARRQLESVIGSKAELVISSGLYKGSYPSSLEELDNGLIGVYHPTHKGAFLPALRNTELLMKIEAPNSVYQAVTTAARSSLDATIPILWLKLASTLEKVQRRMFVRVPSTIKAHAFFLGGMEEEELPEGVVLPLMEWFDVRIADISLGGIGISIKQDLVPFCLEGGRYLLSIKIGNTDFFLVGKIVKILSKREGSIVVGFAYEALSVSTEKIMVGYIRQQELLNASPRG